MNFYSDLEDAVIDVVLSITSSYIQAVNELVSSSDKPLTDNQSICIIANIMYTAQDFLPRMQKMFLKKTPLQIYKLVELQEKTEATFNSFSLAFGQQRGRAIVQVYLVFHTRLVKPWCVGV